MPPSNAKIILIVTIMLNAVIRVTPTRLINMCFTVMLLS